MFQRSRALAPFRFLRNCSLSADVFQGASFGIIPPLTLVSYLFHRVISLFYEKQRKLMDFPALKKVTLNERASLDRPLEDACPLMSSSARSCEFSVHYVWNGAKARLTRDALSFSVTPLPLLFDNLWFFSLCCHKSLDVPQTHLKNNNFFHL